MGAGSIDKVFGSKSKSGSSMGWFLVEERSREVLLWIHEGEVGHDEIGG